MTPSRLVLLTGLLALAYTPQASAKFITNVLPSPTDIPVQMELTAPEGMGTATTMTRASFTAMVVEHLYTNEQIENCFWEIAPTLPPTFTLLYTDVNVNNMYAKKLCVAMHNGIARGYRDGSFHPDQTITFSEASKILARAYALTPYAEATNKDIWYAPYAYALTTHNAVPTTVTTLEHTVTVGETIEMLDRLSNDIRTRPSTPYSQLDARLKAEAMRVQRTEAQMKKASTVVLPTTPATTTSKPTSSSTSSESATSESSSATPWYKLF